MYSKIWIRSINVSTTNAKYIGEVEEEDFNVVFEGKMPSPSRWNKYHESFQQVRSSAEPVRTLGRAVHSHRCVLVYQERARSFLTGFRTFLYGKLAGFLHGPNHAELWELLAASSLDTSSLDIRGFVSLELVDFIKLGSANPDLSRPALARQTTLPCRYGRSAFCLVRARVSSTLSLTELASFVVAEAPSSGNSSSSPDDVAISMRWSPFCLVRVCVSSGLSLAEWTSFGVTGGARSVSCESAGFGSPDDLPCRYGRSAFCLVWARMSSSLSLTESASFCAAGVIASPRVSTSRLLAVTANWGDGVMPNGASEKASHLQSSGDSSGQASRVFGLAWQGRHLMFGPASNNQSFCRVEFEHKLLHPASSVRRATSCPTVPIVISVMSSPVTWPFSIVAQIHMSPPGDPPLFGPSQSIQAFVSGAGLSSHVSILLQDTQNSISFTMLNVDTLDADIDRITRSWSISTSSWECPRPLAQLPIRIELDFTTLKQLECFLFALSSVRSIEGRSSLGIFSPNLGQGFVNMRRTPEDKSSVKTLGRHVRHLEDAAKDPGYMERVAKGARRNKARAQLFSQREHWEQLASNDDTKKLCAMLFRSGAMDGAAMSSDGELGDQRRKTWRWTTKPIGTTTNLPPPGSGQALHLIPALVWLDAQQLGTPKYVLVWPANNKVEADEDD
ncbi:hypothetical protein B0H11DRAFT_1922354 [Mycena galericulata]|nr:hypothetical protein B0H11DRAFT_1922354 [Mycena galericulata]